MMMIIICMEKKLSQKGDIFFLATNKPMNPKRYEYIMGLDDFST
jgi:hypothetical protein